MIKSYTTKYSLDITCALPALAARYGGVYAIQHKETGEMYIGMTTRTFKERWEQHRKDLLANKHANSKLQFYYHEGSMSCLLFIPLEAYPLPITKDLHEIEARYIKEFGVMNERG